MGYIGMGEGLSTYKDFWEYVPDKSVDLKNAILIMQILSKMNVLLGPSANYSASDIDVDGDGKIGLPELIYVLQRVAGVR
jgi:hypothetical protein